MGTSYLGAHSFGTEHTEYQFPKEQTLCYFENRIADVTKIKVMRPRESVYAIFPPNDRRKFPKTRLPAILSVSSKQTAIPFIPSILLSGAELTEYYSIHSGIRISPKRTQLPSIDRVFSFQNSPKYKRTRTQTSD